MHYINLTIHSLIFTIKLNIYTINIAPSQLTYIKYSIKKILLFVVDSSNSGYYCLIKCKNVFN